jgi:hypothetical protein
MTGIAYKLKESKEKEKTRRNWLDLAFSRRNYDHCAVTPYSSSLQEQSIGYFRQSDLEKLFIFLLFPYSLTGIPNNVPNCTFPDCTATFLGQAVVYLVEPL